MEYFKKINEDKNNTLKKSIEEDLQKDVDLYYDFESRSRVKSITVESANPSGNFYDFNFDFISNPTYNTKGITYFFNGTISKQATSKFLAKKESNDYTFDPTKGSFQIFLRYSILKPIIDDISKSERFFFNLRQSTLSKSFIFYKLDIEHLGQIIPGVYQVKARDEQVYISANVKDIVVDSTMATKGSCNVLFTVYDENQANVLFSWLSSIDYQLQAYYEFKTDANFQIKSLELKSTIIKKNTYGEVNLSILNEWIESSLSTFTLKEIDKFSLFRKPVDLTLFFKSITTFENVEDGILMGGEPVVIPLFKNNLNQEFLSKIKEAF